MRLEKSPQVGNRDVPTCLLSSQYRAAPTAVPNLVLSLQFDMQRITLEELKHILYHAFRDHLTMKDIENIIINEEESLNENSGNCQTEFEGEDVSVLLFSSCLLCKTQSDPGRATGRDAELAWSKILCFLIVPWTVFNSALPLDGLHGYKTVVGLSFTLEQSGK